MTTGDKAELLPCPFCGGAAKMEFAAAFWIECESCHVQTSPWGTRKKAVSAWNTRAPSPPSSGDKLLGELLATIHRDGGQYRIQHGDEKATQDAIEIVAALTAAGVSGVPEVTDPMRERLERRCHAAEMRDESDVLINTRDLRALLAAAPER